MKLIGSFIALAVGLSLYGQSAQQQVLISQKIASGISVTGKTCVVGATGATNPAVCTWSSAPSIGETIHCAAANFGATSAFAGTDNAGTPNTYSTNGSIYNGSFFAGFQQFLDSFSISSSPTTTSITITGTPSFVIVVCFSTTGGVGAADGPVGTGTSASPISINITPVSSTDIAWAFGVCLSGKTMGAGAGYALIPGAASNQAGEYKILSGSGTQVLTMTTTGTMADVIAATYK